MGIQNQRERAGKNRKKIKLNELTAIQQTLWDGFIIYEKERGIKNMEKKVFHLTRFFLYVNSMAVDIFELTYKGAQEFQTYLCTLENKDGTPHYATLTVESIINMVKRFYNYLKNIGKIYTNPFYRIKRIKTERKLPKNLPHEKIMNDILEKLSRFWEQKYVRDKKVYYKAHVMAELMYATGLRIGEVMKLQREDVDFDNKTITVREGKGGKDRIAYLNDYASAVLKIYANEMKEIVNRNKKSKILFGISCMSTISTYHKVFKRICKEYGISRFTSHSFRHTLGFHLLRRGCDMRYIQLILGHENMNTTTIYTKVEKSDLRSKLDTCHPRQFGKDRNGTA